MENFKTDVPLKSNGKSAQFFIDRVVFNGKCIRYNEIKTLATTSSTTIHTWFFIPVARSFDGWVHFKMNNGKTYRINMNSMSIFGIPFIRNPRKNMVFYPPLFDALYSIVAKSMAQKYIDLISGGATVEVAGLTINSLEAKSKATRLKKVNIINKENYHQCQFTNNYGIEVYNKMGVIIWESSWNYKNALLVPYILDAIYR